jgi:hypothetical protein
LTRRHRIDCALSGPRKPWQKGCDESFHCKFWRLELPRRSPSEQLQYPEATLFIDLLT